MKLQVSTAVKISTVIFWSYEPCTLKDGHQCPKRPREMHCGKKDCTLLVVTPSMLHIHLPSKVSEIGPYDAAIA